MNPFTSSGKEILRHGAHFADMRDPQAAEAVAILLNKGRLFTADITSDEAEKVREAIWK